MSKQYLICNSCKSYSAIQGTGIHIDKYYCTKCKSYVDAYDYNHILRIEEEKKLEIKRKEEIRKNEEMKEVYRLKKESIILSGYNIPCDTCGEVIWKFISCSPTCKSSTWICEYCSKKVIIRNDLDSLQLRTDLERKPLNGFVKREVWNRDRGKCVLCGSNEKLEYDHIIPHSKGGSDTARNLQLLCEKCNRKKSAKLDY